MFSPFPRRALALLAACLAAACNQGGSSGSVRTSALRVDEVGSLLADPARERVYVADRTSNRLLAIDPRTGGTDGEVALGAAPSGLASDDLGKELYVAVPARSGIVTIDAATLTIVREVRLRAPPNAIVWERDGFVLAATPEGLLEIDVATGAANVAVADVRVDALLTADRSHSVFYAAQSAGAQIELFRYEPNRRADGTRSVLLPRTGPPAGPSLSFDELRLIVGARGDGSIAVLDAVDLRTIDVIAWKPGPVALVESPTATRLYVADGSAQAEGLDLARYEPLQTVLTPDAIRPRGLVVDEAARHLMVHLVDDSVRSIVLFDAQLDGAPIVTAGTDYALTIEGEPLEGFVLYAGASAGVSFLDPPGTPDPRFLDLDLSSAVLLAGGTLDGAGRFTATLPIDPDEVDGYVFLQAVLLGGPGGGLRAVSNPRVVHVVRPTP